MFNNRNILTKNLYKVKLELTNLKIKTETDIIIDTIKVGVTRMDNGPDF